MGLCPIDVQIIRQVLRILRQDNPARTPRLAVLGYQDVLMPDDLYHDYFGPQALAQLENRPQAETLRNVHGVGPEVSCIPTLNSFFGLFGPLEYDVFDFNAFQGEEKILDLNHPLPDAYAGRYDLVIDGGVLEHVFHMGQALFNVAKMVRLGGFALHAVPMNRPNHGFYNINPTLLCDFYQANGFQEKLRKGVQEFRQGGRIHFNPMEIPHYDPFDYGPHPMDLLFLARRTMETDEAVIPTQFRYQEQCWGTFG